MSTFYRVLRQAGESRERRAQATHPAADGCYGRAAAVQAERAQTLTAAYHAHPGRFVRKPPAPPKLPGTSWINPPQEKEAATQ